MLIRCGFIIAHNIMMGFIKYVNIFIHLNDYIYSDTVNTKRMQSKHIAKCQ